jgi:hypothetical protein
MSALAGTHNIGRSCTVPGDGRTVDLDIDPQLWSLIRLSVGARRESAPCMPPTSSGREW